MPGDDCLSPGIPSGLSVPRATLPAMLLQWLTFVSATLAAAFQGRRAVQGWLYTRMDRRAARRSELAGWSRGGVGTWSVRPADPPGAQPGTLTLTRCPTDREPSPDHGGP